MGTVTLKALREGESEVGSLDSGRRDNLESGGGHWEPWEGFGCFAYLFNIYLFGYAKC